VSVPSVSVVLLLSLPTVMMLLPSAYRYDVEEGREMMGRWCDEENENVLIRLLRLQATTQPPTRAPLPSFALLLLCLPTAMLLLRSANRYDVEEVREMTGRWCDEENKNVLMRLLRLQATTRPPTRSPLLSFALLLVCLPRATPQGAALPHGEVM